ncbi:class I SAM-dependent methyltransferase [Nocardioides sp.]|uniref:class I SAM-dependent methyltransferase n=1 Tax=Nocardioides sp. TaxID=35761 RepID=UPI00271D2991|nr:class I SAM-dependent methyltransferase [Nocardioides sp.]MDO9457686.1 transferase [Nocardioides sp.]
MTTGPDPTVRCRSCRAEVGDVVLDLGHQPSAETFPARSVDPSTDERHRLRMGLCGACGLAQLMEDPGTVEEQTMVVEPLSMTEQAEATLAFAAAHVPLGAGTRVVELGSPHGGSLVPRLEAAGLTVLSPGAPEAAGSTDVVVDVYGLLHDADQTAALAHRVALLRPGGALVLQLHTLASVIAVGQFSELRHGHFAYWSLPALDGALRRHGLGVHRARRFPLDHGTLAVVATASPEPDDETLSLLAAERAAGVTDPQVLRTLQHGADVATGHLRDWLVAERDAGRSVMGYGAAGRSVPLLCHGAIDASLLPAVADAATTKHGRRLPGTDIPIVTPADLLARRPDRVLLFLPDLLTEVRRALPEVEAAGGRWVVLTPAPRVVDPE